MSKVRETAHFACFWNMASWEHFKNINHPFRRI